MSEFQITTPHGKRLAGELIHPVDAGDAVIIFAHGFLEERSGAGRFETFAKAFRRAGYATCCFDFAGSGQSDDAPITVTGQELDLRSICNWLADRGYLRQSLFTTGFSAKVALRSRPRGPKTLVALDPLITSSYIDWDQVFSDEQLQQLDRTGQTTIEDDLNPQRQAQTITKQTLADLSQSDPQALLGGIDGKLLLFIGDGQDEAPTLAACKENFHLLRKGSQLQVMPSRIDLLTAQMSEAEKLQQLRELDEKIADQTLAWLRLHFPAHL